MCDSLVATGPYTASGATLFAKNSDRKLGECQPFLQFPAAFYPRGAELRCTHIAIPQVAETYRVMGHSPWWVWGFEHGVNEHGVAIGNHTVFSKEPVEEKPGLIGMDLVRLGLERGRDAREALEVIAALLEANGQGGAALAPDASGYHNSFLLADPTQAWALETSGRRWAARPLERGSLSNHLSLGDDWTIASRDLDSFARGEGWWREPGRLNMASAYRNDHVPGRISEGRWQRSRALICGRNDHDELGLQAALRDHGGRGAPPSELGPDDADYFTLCMHSEPVGTTTASMVASLPADRTAPWPVWISFATPCSGIFLPIYIDGVIPAPLARGGESFDGESAWWIFHRLGESAARDPVRNTPLLREGWATLEEKIAAEQKSVETDSRAAAEAGDAERASELLSNFMARTVELVLDGALGLRARIDG